LFQIAGPGALLIRSAIKLPIAPHSGCSDRPGGMSYQKRILARLIQPPARIDAPSRRKNASLVAFRAASTLPDNVLMRHAPGGGQRDDRRALVAADTPFTWRALERRFRVMNATPTVALPASANGSGIQERMAHNGNGADKAR
jgi:hypothetical protein